MTELSLRERLQAIQLELVAPKNQVNSFGHYNYRSCEDILEAVKPLLKKYNCLLTIADNIVLVGDRYYVKAQVMLKSADGEAELFVEAFAREELDKKGMDGSQITGASSSYARKYALNGLFLIDDTKDSDTTNKHEKSEKEKAVDNFGEVIICDVCGEKLVFKKGTAKDGREYEGWFCPNGTPTEKHSVKKFKYLTLKAISGTSSP